jgi:hypothetical protein
MTTLITESAMEAYKYLWETSNSPWALFHVNKSQSAELPNYLIVNTMERNALLIEDNNLAASIKTKMLEAGASIVWKGNGF